MRKQILIMLVLGFFAANLNSAMAQNRPERGQRQEQVDELTKAQIKTVNSILSEYDSEELTSEDAKAIMEAFRKEKIPGGKGLEDAVSNAGFDLKGIMQLAPPPERPQRGRGNH